MLTRRLFLSMAFAGLLPPQERSQRIVRSARPEDLEMPADGFSDFITPIERFFVRTHVAVPKVDVEQWRLKVEGHVSSPLTLTIDELRKMPSTELAGVLECAGNGRSFYEPPVAGLQWQNGAAGNGNWRGVRLAEVLQRAGVKPGAVDILFDGADSPIGTMEDFQRSIPLKKALDASTILAYAMNGETLPVKHGFPLRAVVPGWAGNSWVKWITGVRVLNEPAGGFWMKNAYLHPGKPVAPGAAVPADAMSSVTRLRVKSVIAAPAHGSTLDIGKPYVVRGAAWTGDGGGRIAAIDVSIDQGRSWKPARLTGPATPFGWRLWEYQWTPAQEQRYTILARARDTSGDVQPMLQEWNPSGYLWNVVARADVDAGKSSAAPPAAGTRSSVQAPAGFRERCLVCHDDDVIRQQRLTRAQWDREINKMVGWGARVSPEDRPSLLDYLLGIGGTGQ
jgi:DMSO/TMAO reductase YedYZ molybdopterin-dependent catalytic subunit